MVVTASARQQSPVRFKFICGRPIRLVCECIAIRRPPPTGSTAALLGVCRPPSSPAASFQRRARPPLQYPAALRRLGSD